jgi:hypothetical protein
LSLQWRKDGTNLMDSARISGATATLSAMANSHTNWLIMENLQTNDAGNYSVVITNNYGSITSVLASLTVGVAPVVTNQPASQTNVVGASVVFRAGAGGTEPFSYQWRQNGTNLLNGGRISGATSSVLAVANIQLTDAGGYDVVVTNDYGYTNSSIATLGVQADNGGDGGGGTNGGSNLSGGLLLWLPFDGNAQDVSGNGRDGVVQGAVLTTNRFGKADSAYAFDGSSAITVANLDPDGYTNGFSFGAWIEPNGFGGAMGWTYDAGWGSTFIAAGGSSIQFRVGTGDPSTDHSVSAIVPLQSWSHVLIAHSPTNDSLYVNGQLMGQWPSHLMAGNASAFTVGTSYAGNFNGAIDDVIVYGRELSSDEVAALYDGASPGGSDANFPRIISQPVSLTVTNGGSGSFSVRAFGASPFSYQWRKDGTNLTDGGNISGAATTNLSLVNAQFADAGNYDVIVTNLYGSTTSLVASLAVTLLVNGSFEDGSNPPVESWSSLYAGDLSITGWMVASGRIDWSGTLPQYGLDPQDGRMSAQMVGNGSAISQTFATVPGQTYEVSFYLKMQSANSTPVTVGVTLDGLDWFSAILPAGPETNWTYYAASLMASAAGSTLTFSNVDGGYSGPAVDNVSVSPIPVLPSGPRDQLQKPSLSASGFSFDLVADPGTQFTIMVSTNLTDWDPVRTVTVPPGGSTNILEGVTPGARQKFYRAMQQ